MPYNFSDRLRARVLLLSLSAGVLLGTAACTTHEPEAAAAEVAPLPAGSNILLITVDTLRADHLSSYGYVRP